MRMLAHLSADPQLISVFLAEGDFFEIITNRWNANERLHIKVDRNKVKQVNNIYWSKVLPQIYLNQILR